MLGHQVKTIVCGQPIDDTEMNSGFFVRYSKTGVHVRVLLRRSQSKYGALIKWNELKSVWNDVAKSDIIILHQIYQFQYISIFPILLFLGKPYVVMPHGTLTRYQRKQHWKRKLPFYPATYLLLKFAKGIFVATEQEKIELPKYLDNKGIVVGLGIDTKDSQKQISLESFSTFNLLFMGRIVKKKRLDIALQAFAMASKKSNLKMKFIVCGTGEESEISSLKQLVSSLIIESEVEFRGWVDFTEKQMAFQESDCFILTSEDENFAIAAAEALASGVPCILSSKVALASLVAKHRAGVVFEELHPPIIEKAITEIAHMDRQILQNSSLSAASEISWDAVCKQWETALQSFVKF
jgi:glycosyltransferase involved in cell wall biosynthesis